MSEAKLKPCPFCGKVPGFVMQSKNLGAWKYVAIDVCSLSTEGHIKKEDAIAEWNKRTGNVEKKYGDTGLKMRATWNRRAK
jgi:Lar family restriction alleviation protein